MPPKTCLCGLLPLAAGCRVAGWYLILLYGALVAMNGFRLPRQTADLHRLDAALSNCSDPASPAAAALRGQHDALSLAVKLNVIETLFFAANIVLAGALVAGAARRSRALVCAFLCWFAPVTVVQGATLLLAVLRPVYGGVRACSGSGCAEALSLMFALVVLHGYLNCEVFSFLRELRQQARKQGVFTLAALPDSEQQNGTVNYAFED